MNLQTPIATKAVGGAVLALVAVLGWVLLVGPAWAAIGEADVARTDAADANVLLTTQLADLRDQAGDLSRTAESAAELATIFPATADQPGFFADVTEAAQDAGIDASAIDALSPGVPVLLAPPVDPAAAPEAGATPAEGTPATPSDPAASPTTPTTPTAPATESTDPSTLLVQTVSLSVAGTFPELQRLLANLEQMPRALLVRQVSVTEGEDGALTLALEGATFVAPPLVAPQAGAAEGDVGDAGAAGDAGGGTSSEADATAAAEGDAG